MTFSYKRILVSLAIMGLAAGSLFSNSQPDIVLERLKVAYLYNFLKYTHWKQTDKDKLVVGLLADEPTLHLAKKLESKQVHGLDLKIKAFDPGAGGTQGCDLVFVSKAREDQLDRVLEGVRAHPVVSSSDVEASIERGATIEFVIIGSKLRFRINASWAKEKGIVFNSKLLALALEVI